MSPETRTLSCAHPTGSPKSTPSRWLSIRRPPSHPACKFRHFLRLHRYGSSSVVPGPAASAPPGTVPRNTRCQTHGTGVPDPRSGEPCLPEGDNERSSWGTSARCMPGPLSRDPQETRLPKSSVIPVKTELRAPVPVSSPGRKRPAQVRSAVCARRRSRVLVR